MLPLHQPLTVKDLNPFGVAAALIGFVGFTLSLWLLVWMGLNREGRLRRPFFWLALVLVVSCSVMLWGLTKA